MELRFGVNPLKSQPISKDQSSKSTKSRSKKLGKDQDARLEVVTKNSQKTKDFQKTMLKNEPGGKRLDKEVERLGRKFLFRLPVIRSNISCEGSSPAAPAPSYERASRSTPGPAADPSTRIRPTQPSSTEALHIGESLEAESETKTSKPSGISLPNKALIESKSPSKYPANMLIDNYQMQDQGVKWKSKLGDKKVGKKEEGWEDERKSQLSELPPKISALTRSLNSLQVHLN